MFGFGVLSAVIPVFNMEIYIAAVYKTFHPSAFEAAAVGSLGQNIGKLAWYYASRGAIDVPWLRRRIAAPKRQESYARWSGYVQGRPGLSGLLTFVSAAIGFPPFFVMAVVAGTLRMNVVVFFLAGFVGRTLFFWVALLGLGLFLR